MPPGRGLRRAALSLSVFALFTAALWLTLRGAVAGAFAQSPWLSGACLVTSFVGAIVAFYAVFRTLGLWSEPRTLMQRQGFWLIVLAATLYLPTLGSFSLIDPWEGHYAEVSREILARGDPISLWWGNHGFFFSKPALLFWLQALSFYILGVSVTPDEVLQDATGTLLYPEWAARFPSAVLAIVAAYALYKATAVLLGRRAGFLGGLVLITTPLWAFIGRQGMTDMPYVALMSMAIACLMVALNSDPDARVRTRVVHWLGMPLGLSPTLAVLALVLLASLPQILYLASLGVHVTAEGGDPPSLGVPPALMAAVWALILGGFLWRYRRETRISRLLFICAWLFTALGTLAKGAPALLLPLALCLGFLLVRRRFRDVRHIEWAALLLLLACVTLPWFAQMYLRHGEPFVSRLFVHDMYKRAFEQVHHMNPGEDLGAWYYARQLGYGLFPWTGFCALGLLMALGAHAVMGQKKGEPVVFLALWLLGTFALFNLVGTKFHHYILPAVPPGALLAGVFMDRWMARPRWIPAGSGWPYAITAAGGLLLVTVGVSDFFPGSLTGLASAGSSETGGLLRALPLLGFGLLLLLFAGRVYRPIRHSEPHFASYVRPLLACGGLAAVYLTCVIGHHFMTEDATGLAGQARLLHLFTYNYRRPWPENLNFTAAFASFTVVAALAYGAFSMGRLRAGAIVGVASSAVFFTAWGAMVYLPATAQHWGQRTAMEAYYHHRKSQDDVLTTYQHTWKGETFYAGGKLETFEQSGRPFREWLESTSLGPLGVVYTVIEQGRVRVLERELGNNYAVDVLVPKSESNLFTVARVTRLKHRKP